MPDETGYSVSVPMLRDLREMRGLVLGGSQSRRRSSRRRRGGGGEGGEALFDWGLVTDEAGASPHGTLGLTPGTIGKAVLLNADGVAINAAGNPLGSIGAAADADKIQFKSELPIKIWVGAIVDLASDSEITPGTTWDGAGGTTLAKVWANVVNAQPIIVKAPSQIPANGSLLCDVYEWNTSGVLVDSGVNVTCYNIAPAAVAANVNLQAKPIGGRYVIDYEVCPSN
jgi:hypothetical protein